MSIEWHTTRDIIEQDPGDDEGWEDHKWISEAEHLRIVTEARDEEARAAADRVELLPYLDGGRTVNRNLAIIAARRRLPR